jgi:hypothetical protein
MKQLLGKMVGNWTKTGKIMIVKKIECFEKEHLPQKSCLFLLRAEKSITKPRLKCTMKLDRYCCGET